MTAPQPAAVHDVLVEAADRIETNGYCQHYLYSVTQVEAGIPLDRCAVDVLGAINLAVHGSPLYAPGSPLAATAEAAVAARINAPSVAAWCSYRGNGKQQAIDLLRDTAASLREVAA